MKNQKLTKAGLIAGLVLFLLVSILTACETVNCMSELNKGGKSVIELKNSLNDLKIPASLL
ncbi:MAG: hypothetical protein A2452_02645 [Candidatus Firestonebacteria bacterium RIFOXYC2_FULL_39_67]|nr:MAG: hypothetical protein A2452_02645 [Candidatus Firestonebacteria bacterium RIFOXYC2_FULL_39_67]OGF57796.1 MAG: hypothetical protein A2497_03025 [Candidatus Firestonebacteria bacterium RifOxyC12_full_39_7]